MLLFTYICMAKQQRKTITVLTLFPEFIMDYAGFGIVQRAIKNKLLKFEALNLRKFGLDRRGTVDDRPYGGGLGMVLRPDVLYKAITSWRKKKPSGRVIMLTPQGKPFKQAAAARLAKYNDLLFVSGRYEGFDERARKFVDEEISMGDFVLMGGELPALAVAESILRLVPGVLGKDGSADAESFSQSMLEYPQYTKPEVFEAGGKKLRVPTVLLTGHHANIEKWRAEESLKRTKKRRPDLLSS
jgi:tRNA (guanine37-N1)-methyltransferase